MPLIVPGGTLRLIVRPGMGGGTAPPVVGFGVTPLPDGAEPGDLLHIRLLADGSATWRVEKVGAMSAEVDRHNINGMCFNGLFTSGRLGAACWPELIEHRDRVEAAGPLGALADTPNIYLL